MQSSAAPLIRDRNDRRYVGLVGALTQLALAGIVAAVATILADSPPEPIPRGIALGLLYAVPAAIGAIGAVAGRRSLLIAAGVAAAVGSSLSIATLAFLIPALLFVAAATRQGTKPAPSAAGAARGVALGLLVIGLTVGAGWVLLTQTDSMCWIATPTAHGVDYRIVPTINDVSLSGVGQSAGCSSAVFTVRGATMGGVLALGAVALAWIAAGWPRRPSRPGQVSGSGIHSPSVAPTATNNG